MVKLGSKVRDMISGYTGVATGRSDFLFGCAQIAIAPNKLDKEGKVMDVLWFDEQRVEVLKEAGPVVSSDNSASSGGPQNNPPPRSNPGQ